MERKARRSRRAQGKTARRARRPPYSNLRTSPCGCPSPDARGASRKPALVSYVLLPFLLGQDSEEEASIGGQASTASGAAQQRRWWRDVCRVAGRQPRAEACRRAPPRARLTRALAPSVCRRVPLTHWWMWTPCQATRPRTPWPWSMPCQETAEGDADTCAPGQELVATSGCITSSRTRAAAACCRLLPAAAGVCLLCSVCTVG